MQAVYVSRSGTAPVVETDTAPCENEHVHMSVPTAIPFRRESGPPVEAIVSPSKLTDANTIAFPLPLVIVLIGALVGVAGGQWAMWAKVSNLETIHRMSDQSSEKYNALMKDYIDQRFATLEAKIESAGLRNAALAMSQQLDKQRK